MAKCGDIKVRVEIVRSDERERLSAMNALLSKQLEEARQWHYAAVMEKRAAQADAERLFTALDGYIMARITGTDLRDYDDLAERAARAHRALATDVPGKLDRTVLDPETGIEEPVTTGRIPDAEFVEPPLMAPAASPDERLREAAERLTRAVEVLDLSDPRLDDAGPYETLTVPQSAAAWRDIRRFVAEARSALAAADREKPEANA